MNKTEIVKVRVEPRRKQLWKEYAEACLPPLNITDFITLAVDYFVSGEDYRNKKGYAHKLDQYVSTWIITKNLYTEEYLDKFEKDAREEIERKKERNKKRLAGEFD